MLNFLARRVAATIPVMLIVAILVFLITRLTPGDPAAILAGDAAGTEQIARIRASLGLDQPIVVQFGIWFGKALTGDLGESFYYKMKVTTLIGQRLEPTLALAAFTILIAVGEDYNILLMARVEEEQKRHGPVGGITEALVRTGPIISSCGLIMAGTFGSLMAGSLTEMTQLGFALAFALLTGGLLSSTAHLGRPERAWRAFSQWRTSWLSREGVMAVATCVPAGLTASVSSRKPKATAGAHDGP